MKWEEQRAAERSNAGLQLDVERILEDVQEFHGGTLESVTVVVVQMQRDA